MLSTTETKYYTPEEYLALEETSEDKNEYRQGEIIPMVGATTNHNQIAGNGCIPLKSEYKYSLREL